ncbi:MAG: hypothetical protein VX346_18885 [Planctomycetota bacterium]|nr:hypothetical protein [Planctomycetota bacterium]
MGFKNVLGGGGLTGLLTGMGCSLLLDFFSRDNEVSGREALTALAVPLLMALFVWNAHRFGLWKTRLWILVVVAYLTMLIPLFGISIGGANFFQMALAGFLGGAFWSAPFAIGGIVISRMSATNDVAVSNDVNSLPQEP